MKLAYTKIAAEAIRSLSPFVKPHIKQIIEALLQEPYAGKPLQQELIGYRSVAYKRYRIIYKIDDEQDHIEIQIVKHRKDVYSFMQQLLADEDKKN